MGKFISLALLILLLISSNFGISQSQVDLWNPTKYPTATFYFTSTPYPIQPTYTFQPPYLTQPPYPTEVPKTGTPIIVPTATISNSTVPQVTETFTSIPTVFNTATPVIIDTETATSMPSETPTIVPSETETLVPTSTPTFENTVTATETELPTEVETPTDEPTWTDTPEPFTVTPTATESATATFTSTPIPPTPTPVTVFYNIGTDYGNHWSKSGNITFEKKRAVFSAKNTAVNGKVWQPLWTGIGRNYTLTFTVSKVDCNTAALAAQTRLTISSNSVTIFTITKQVGTHSINFIGAGNTVVLFQDITNNTVNCDLVLSNITLN